MRTSIAVLLRVLVVLGATSPLIASCSDEKSSDHDGDEGDGGAGGTGASGGDGGGGGGGSSSGTGGSGPTPACVGYATKEAVAACPNAPTGGADVCETQLMASKCTAEALAFYECVAGPGTIVCDGDGFSQYVGCEEELQAHVDCLVP